MCYCLGGFLVVIRKGRLPGNGIPTDAQDPVVTDLLCYHVQNTITVCFYKDSDKFLEKKTIICSRTYPCTSLHTPIVCAYMYVCVRVV